MTEDTIKLQIFSNIYHQTLFMRYGARRTDEQTGRADRRTDGKSYLQRSVSHLKRKKATNNINNICNANQKVEETYCPISPANTTMAETVLIYIMKKNHFLKIKQHLQAPWTKTSFTFVAITRHILICIIYCYSAS